MFFFLNRFHKTLSNQDERKYLYCLLIEFCNYVDIEIFQTLRDSETYTIDRVFISFHIFN